MTNVDDIFGITSIHRALFDGDVDRVRFLEKSGVAYVPLLR